MYFFYLAFFANPHSLIRKHIYIQLIADTHKGDLPATCAHSRVRWASVWWRLTGVCWRWWKRKITDEKGRGLLVKKWLVVFLLPFLLWSCCFSTEQGFVGQLMYCIAEYSAVCVSLSVCVMYSWEHCCFGSVKEWVCTSVEWPFIK